MLLKKPIIRIDDVVLNDRSGDSLRGFDLTRPKKNEKSQLYTLNISGWVIGRTSQAAAVEILSGDEVLRKVDVQGNRPAAVESFPDLADNANCAFKTSVGVVGLPPRTELKLNAILKDGSRVLLADLRLRHELLRVDYRPALEPIALNAMGRSGTTWLMKILSTHPDIIICDWPPFEIRNAQYWLQMLHVLSQPANPRGKAADVAFLNESEVIGCNPYFQKGVGRAETFAWYGYDYIADLASFCLRSIDNFYLHIAETQGKKPIGAGTHYFAEKVNAARPRALFRELYAGSKEILLVRDFRDLICSVFAFNAKRGSLDFGRADCASDEEYIILLASNARTNLLKMWRERRDDLHLVRYEDLILNPLDSVTSLLDHLGLDHSRKAVERMVKKASADTEKLKDHATSRDPRASIGRWKNDLDPALRGLCNEVLAEVLAEFGYSVE